MFSHKAWDMASSEKAIVHYPEFYFGALSNSEQSVYNPYSIDGSIRKHLTRMKLLLLYFHHISMPFSHFFLYFNDFYSHLYDELFGNSEFRNLIAKGYIIYELKAKYDPLSYFDRFEGLLRDCDFQNISPPDGELRSIFSDLLVVERGDPHSTRSFGMRDGIEAIVSKSTFSKEDSESIKQAIDKSLSGDNAFMHEVFLNELREPQFKDLHDAVANVYLEVSETSNYKTLTYTPAKDSNFGSLLRKNTSNNVYAFLYSPDFFLFFLSLFIDLQNEVNVYLLTSKKVEALRECNFWNDFVSEYHEILLQVSAQLDFVSEGSILAEAEKAISNELKAGILQRSSYALLRALLGDFLKGDKFPSTVEVVEEIFNMKQDVALTQLKFKYSATHTFLLRLSSLLRNNASS